MAWICLMLLNYPTFHEQKKTDLGRCRENAFLCIGATAGLHRVSSRNRPGFMRENTALAALKTFLTKKGPCQVAGFQNTRSRHEKKQPPRSGAAENVLGYF